MKLRTLARTSATALAAATIALAPVLALAPAAGAAPQVFPFGTTITSNASKNVVSITGVATGSDSDTGTPITQIALTYTAGDQAIEGWQLMWPTLTYGAAGTPAEHNYTYSSDLFSGVVAPHTTVTLKYAYDVTYTDLNPATLSAGIGFYEDYVWSGDLASRITPPPPAPKPFGGIFGS
ncbi:hypothetical protein [Rhodococcus opacus]|uniref:Uncharacterized protein n=1 Tax=Rhodococcus opacus TaxID=37919 RepID=A0A076EYD2_RHOOP|nr:hypothetical protein [Rhodococcus opacus]AII10398.1 hypothetical protein EP51_39530 [Rhodococcus opacus]